MSVQVSSGSAYVANTLGAFQGYYAVTNDGTVTVALDASHSNFNRTDLIVLTVKDAQYAGSENIAVIDKVTGAAGPGANPAPGVVPANSIILASILVPASSSSIAFNNIGYALRQYARVQPSMANAVQVVQSGAMPFAPYNGQLVVTEDTGTLQAQVNGTWRTLSPVTVANYTSTSKPLGKAGMLAYETDTKRYYSHDGTKWNYLGGGNGEIITKTFTNWSPIYSQPFGFEAGQQPLTLWRSGEGRYCLEGMLTNAQTITSWQQYVQYWVTYLPNGYAPPTDVRGTGFVVIPGVGNWPIHILIRGTHPSTVNPGSVGSIYWQPQDSYYNTNVAPGFFQLKVSFISWEAP